jgi:hypothetical protein
MDTFWPQVFTEYYHLGPKTAGMQRQIVPNPETEHEEPKKGSVVRDRQMAKRRWMISVLKQSKADQIEMPWSRSRRARRRMQMRETRIAIG